jgi:organic radical activating enzyme
MVSFHVEPTSKCTLECTLCDRTWFYETFKKRNLHEINVDHLVNFVGANAEIHFCGNNGDPIYHSKFHDLCKRLKDNNCQLKITTNGSAKTKAWWQKLNNIMDKDDTLILSIDGLEDTNHIYRKNAKWKTIMNGIEVFKKSKTRKCRLTWKYIVFKHNEHQIEQAKKLCFKLGFDAFKLEQSDRWLDNKDLMPTKYVDNIYQHQEKVLSDADYRTNMKPRCMNNDLPTNNLYIDAEGNFYPCCWMGTYRYKYRNVFSPKQNNFNIKDTTLEDLLGNEIVTNFFESTKQFTSAHECCKLQCGVNNG